MLHGWNRSDGGTRMSRGRSQWRAESCSTARGLDDTPGAQSTWSGLDSACSAYTTEAQALAASGSSRAPFH